MAEVHWHVAINGVEGKRPYRSIADASGTAKLIASTFGLNVCMRRDCGTLES